MKHTTYQISSGTLQAVLLALGERPDTSGARERLKAEIAAKDRKRTRWSNPLPEISEPVILGGQQGRPLNHVQRARIFPDGAIHYETYFKHAGGWHPVKDQDILLVNHHVVFLAEFLSEKIIEINRLEP